MPAKINSKKYNELMKIALKAHNLLFVEELQGQILNFTKISFIY